MWKTGPVQYRDIDPEALSEEFALKNLRFTEYKLTWKQRRLLKRYGTRMQAYMDERVIPIMWNHRGKHFVDMCNGLVEPHDEYERIWKSYISTLDEERRLRKIHEANLARQNRRQLPSLYLSGNTRISEELVSYEANMQIGESWLPQTRRCPRCRGEGFDCPRCDGRGEIPV
jgi:uncharacterized protein YifE (UPF0438 family)